MVRSRYPRAQQCLNPRAKKKDPRASGSQVSVISLHVEILTSGHGWFLQTYPASCGIECLLPRDLISGGPVYPVFWPQSRPGKGNEVHAKCWLHPRAASGYRDPKVSSTLPRKVYRYLALPGRRRFGREALQIGGRVRLYTGDRRALR